ncbi:BAG family molecular chaperone regulator 4 [Madurella mycetomatis]|uniref:BAG family molecular chaperone regulator 4 n=1 Tax=Madurella mycetomatis TaxID=100816 RepID=A0A175W678_9PEZI|nr:BAG family molecular chaperone regulator 4 [Madurella mycetomatis]
MRRYGFSRGGLSPFSSTLGQDGVPNVTDDDFSYITSAEIEDHAVDIPQRHIPHTHVIDHYSHSAPSLAYSRHIPEDDVILIKYQGITYPEHFPAYSIGDGQLIVSDIQERIKMILGLEDGDAKRIKLYYKGRRLKNPDKPAREYGVKNNSEVRMALAESNHGSGSEASEEVVVIDGRRFVRRSPQGESPKSGRSGRWDERSPRDSSSQLGLEVPTDGTSKRGKSRVRTQSPSGSNVSTASAPAGIPGGPIEKLNDIAAHFNTKLVPLCLQFVARPPSDPKKRSEEHTKLSETIMQHVLLKLDAIETSGEEGARARRKELVKQVQAVLKEIDEAKQ